MKLLDVGSLLEVSNLLSGAFGDTRVSCRLESYSCKMAGDDKRLFKQLSAKTDIDQMEALSPSPATSSPFGPQAVFLGANGHLAASTGMQYQGSPVFGAAGQQSSSMGTMGATGELHYQCSRRTLYYLKATLNAAFQPDYDFSDAGSHEFSREPSEAWVQRIIAGNMKTSLGTDFDLVAPALWKTISEHIVPEECNIYSYNPDLQSDPFAAEGGLWSFNYFWYNKKLKRVLFFRGRAVSYSAPMLDDEAFVPNDIFIGGDYENEYDHDMMP